MQGKTATQNEQFIYIYIYTHTQEYVCVDICIMYYFIILTDFPIILIY